MADATAAAWTPVQDISAWTPVEEKPPSVSDKATALFQRATKALSDTYFNLSQGKNIYGEAKYPEGTQGTNPVAIPGGPAPENVETAVQLLFPNAFGEGGESLGFIKDAAKGAAKIAGGVKAIAMHPLAGGPLGAGLIGSGASDLKDAAGIVWNAFKAAGGSTPEEFEAWLNRPHVLETPKHPLEVNRPPQPFNPSGGPGVIDYKPITPTEETPATSPARLDEIAKALAKKPYEKLNPNEARTVQAIANAEKAQAAAPASVAPAPVAPIEPPQSPVDTSAIPTKKPPVSLTQAIDEFIAQRKAQGLPVEQAATPAPATVEPPASPVDTSGVKVLPFKQPNTPAEVFAAKNRAPRVQQFADYLEQNKVPASDLAQLPEDSPFWGQLGKAVGINKPSKQTIMETISELRRREATMMAPSSQYSEVLKRPGALAAAAALRDAMASQ